MAATVSLYEQVGGQDGIDKVVDVFYRYGLNDARIAHFFDGVGMDQQTAKQKQCLAMAFGGPGPVAVRTCARATGTFACVA